MSEKHGPLAYTFIPSILVGLGVVAVVQMLSVERLDLPLTVSIFSFAVSIPCNSANVICMIAKGEHGTTANSRLATAGISAVIRIGVLSSFVGISGLFFHFTKYAGIVFIVFSVLGLMLWTAYDLELERERK